MLLQMGLRIEIKIIRVFKLEEIHKQKLFLWSILKINMLIRNAEVQNFWFKNPGVSGKFLN